MDISEGAVLLRRGGRRIAAPDYERERERIRTIYGESTAEAGAQRDQALAALFHRSGWTQEELAKAEGVGQQYVARRLLFGRFLAFTPAGVNPRNLSEWRFRSYWERTDKAESNERIRFAAVLKLIEAETTLSKSTAPKRELGTAIVEQFGDGKWHQLATIVSHAAAPEYAVTAVLELMRQRGTYRSHCERKKVGTSWHYRIARHDGRTVALELLKQELRPILEGLKAQGRKNMATISIEAVADLARQLEQLLEKLAK